jgi:hypothetical protein
MDFIEYWKEKISGKGIAVFIKGNLRKQENHMKKKYNVGIHLF